MFINLNNKSFFFIFILFSFWLSFEFIFLGSYSYVTMFDMGDIHIPFNKAASDDLYKFGIHYWNKNHKIGTDLVSEGYLWSNLVALCLQFILMPSWLAYGLSKFLSFFLAGYFTYLISTKILKCDFKSSFIAALIFSLIAGNYDSEGLTSKYMLPFFVYIIFYLSNKSRLYKFYFLTAIPVGLLYASSSFVIWDYYSLLFIFIFLTTFSINKKYTFFYFVLFALTMFIYQLQLLIPMLLNSSESQRFILDFNLYGQYVKIYDEITLGHHKNKQEYIFIFNIFLILFFLIKKKIFNKNLKILFFILILNILVGLIIPLIQYMMSNIIPQITSIEAGRSFKITFHFTIVLIVGLLFSLNRSKYIFIFALIFFFIFSLIPKYNHLKLYLLKGHSFNNVFNSQILHDLKKSNKENYRVVTLTNDTTNSAISSNVMMYYGLEEATGYSSLHSKRYDDLWNILSNGKSNGNRLHLNRLYNHEGPVSFNETNNIELLSLINVKYIISDYELKSSDLELIHMPQKSILKDEYRLRELSFFDFINKIKYIHSGENFYIYKNKKVLPRFFLSSNYEILNTKNVLFEKLKNSSATYLKENILYLSDNSINLQSKNSLEENNYVYLSNYSPDYLEFNVELEDSSILVISNSYSKYWRVFVDDRPRQLLPAYNSLWSVVLNKNDKKVTFKYLPPYKIY
jgi:hypothetical protein